MAGAPIIAHNHISGVSMAVGHEGLIGILFRDHDLGNPVGDLEILIKPKMVGMVSLTINNS